MTSASATMRWGSSGGGHAHLPAREGERSPYGPGSRWAGALEACGMRKLRVGRLWPSSTRMPHARGGTQIAARPRMELRRWPLSVTVWSTPDAAAEALHGLVECGMVSFRPDPRRGSDRP